MKPLPSVGGGSGAVAREIYGADLRVGTEYAMASYTLGESELVSFASQWDPFAMHTDKAAAASGPHGGLIASGLQTLSIYQRLAVLSVFSNWRVIAGRCMRDVRFLQPVRADDTLSGSLSIDALEPDARNRTKVTASATLINQKGKSVLSVVVEAYVQTRPEKLAS